MHRQNTVYFLPPNSAVNTNAAELKAHITDSLLLYRYILAAVLQRAWLWFTLSMLRPAYGSHWATPRGGQQRLWSDKNVFRMRNAGGWQGILYTMQSRVAGCQRSPNKAAFYRIQLLTKCVRIENILEFFFLCLFLTFFLVVFFCSTWNLFNRCFWYVIFTLGDKKAPEEKLRYYAPGFLIQISICSFFYGRKICLGSSPQ